MIFAERHYVNGLDTARFCSSLQRRLIRQQSVRDDSSIVRNFIHDSCYLYTEHLMIERRLKSMKDSISEQLHAIGVSKKRYSFCAAVAVVVAVNAIPVSVLPRALIGVTGPAGSILFGALGRWQQSVLNKRETTVKKHREITEHMSAGAGLGMKYLFDIHHVAIRLHLETESLSESTDYGEKVAAVIVSFEELLRTDEAYGKSMESVKQEVLVNLRGV